MTDTFASCRFTQVFDENTFCRFDPPEFIPPNSSALKPVAPTGWCGEYDKVQKPKRTTKAPSSAS